MEFIKSFVVTCIRTGACKKVARCWSLWPRKKLSRGRHRRNPSLKNSSPNKIFAFCNYFLLAVQSGIIKGKGRASNCTRDNNFRNDANVGIKEQTRTVARYDARQEGRGTEKKTSGETRYLTREKLKCQVAVKTQASAYLFHYRAGILTGRRKASIYSRALLRSTCANLWRTRHPHLLFTRMETTL